MTPIQWFDIVYLTLVFVMLVLLLLLSYRRSRNDSKILELLASVSTSNAESARKSVQATQDALDLLKKATDDKHP